MAREVRVVSSGPVRQMVFVAHQVAGVRLIPQEWLDGFRPSGFREATAREIARWHEERGLELPADDAPAGAPILPPGGAPAGAGPQAGWPGGAPGPAGGPAADGRSPRLVSVE